MNRAVSGRPVWISNCFYRTHQSQADNYSVVHWYHVIVFFSIIRTLGSTISSQNDLEHRLQGGRGRMRRCMNVLALVKESEKYIFLYDDESPNELLQQLGKYASDDSLSFTWYDAAVLSQKVRRLRREAEQETEIPYR